MKDHEQESEGTSTIVFELTTRRLSRADEMLTLELVSSICFHKLHSVHSAKLLTKDGIDALSGFK